MKLIPNAIERTHRDAAKFRSRHNGVKDLPPYQHLKTGDIHRAQDALFCGTTTSVSPDNSKETTRREKELETNTMKERGPSENGKYPTLAVDHVSQSQSERDIVESIKGMNLESPPRDLGYKKVKPYANDTTDESDTFLPVLKYMSIRPTESISPSQTELISFQTDASTSHMKRSSDLKLPSINMRPGRQKRK